jgi:hypothetical protein
MVNIIKSMDDFSTLATISERLSRSTFCGVKKAEDALWIVATGAALGLDPLASLRGIHVIKGKPTLSADMMMAVVLRHAACKRFVVTMGEVEASVEVLRDGWQEPKHYTFTRADAQRAGLWGKGTWAQYPQDMLKARAISRAARAAFPDALLGVYVHGELDGDQEEPTYSAPEQVIEAEFHETKQLESKAVALATDEQVYRFGELIEETGVSVEQGEAFASHCAGGGDIGELEAETLSKYIATLEKDGVEARRSRILKALGLEDKDASESDWNAASRKLWAVIGQGLKAAGFGSREVARLQDGYKHFLYQRDNIESMHNLKVGELRAEAERLERMAPEGRGAYIKDQALPFLEQDEEAA